MKDEKGHGSNPRGAEPYLRAAVRVNGRLYKGADHISALSKVPPEQKAAAQLDGSNRGWVDNRGRFLNRERAQKYAVENDLIKPGAPTWVRTMPEAVAEWIKTDETDASPLGIHSSKIEKLK